MREVAEQKTAALRMSLDAVERQGMPFVGEEGVRGARCRRGSCAGGAARDPPRMTAWPAASGGRRRADVPAPGPDRPRLPPPGAAARPADPGARRRLLRAGRPQGPGRHGAASPRRTGSSPTRPSCRRGSTSEVADPARRAWLHVQLDGARDPCRGALAGDRAPVRRARHALLRRGTRPRDEAVFRAAAARLDELVPGAGRAGRAAGRLGRPAGRAGRAAAGGGRLAGGRPSSRVPPSCSGCPTARSLRVSPRTGQPWSGYNWYDGGLRSRVDVNIDLPVRAPELVDLVAHETYPGHHLEHAWKEADLVDERRSARGEHPADQRPGVPHQRGPGRGRPAVRGPCRVGGRAARRAPRPGRPRGSR